MGYSHCVVKHHCEKLDPPVSLTSLAEWRVSVSLVTFARHFPSRVLVTLCLLHVGATHGCEFCDRFVGAFQESLPAGPSVKASLPCLPAAGLLLNVVNAVYRLLLSVPDVSLSLTRVTRTSGIAFSAAIHDCSS